MRAIKHLLLALLLLPLSGLAQTYSLTLVAEPPQGGTVNGAGSYEANYEKTVTASAKTSYRFLGWYDEESVLITTNTSFNYIMPERDATLTARFDYDPDVLDEPQAPDIPEPGTGFKVEFFASPSQAATVTLASYTTSTPGSTVTTKVTPKTGWTFKEWRDELDNVVSDVLTFDYIIPERNSQLTAYFDYTPDQIDDPGNFNSWDPVSGELVITKVGSRLYLANVCGDLITTSERSLVRKLIVADPDLSSNSSYNLGYVRSNLTGLEILDLQNSGFVYFSSYELAISSMTRLILPAGTTRFSTSAFDSTSNANLEEILIYATVPPTEGASCLNYVPETCIIYVPNESVDAYNAATYWRNHIIQPMYSAETAVGPNEAGWNDLSQPHKFPVEYTYTGADGGGLEYMVEENGTWQTIASDLESGAEISSTIVVCFDKKRKVHTIDFRTFESETTTLLPAMRIELVDLSFKSIEVAGPNYYDYGNAVEPAVTLTDPETSEVYASSQYDRLYSSNIKSGRATVRANGVYPYSINSRSTTFDINRLPLPGGLEFVDPEVSLVYNGNYIEPAWRFTDPRNQSLTGSDYSYSWYNTRRVGNASLVVTGRGEFTGSLVLEYEIEKGPVLSYAYTNIITNPETELLYDGNPHGFTTSYKSSYHYAYCGQPIFEYYDHETGEKLPSAPTAAGEYEGWIGFLEGENTVYTAPECRVIYTIFDMTDDEWAAIQALSADLATHGYNTGWSLANKISSLKYSGLTVKKGWVSEINLPSKSLTGSFPESIYAFEHLKRINLSGNLITGTFDGESRSLGAVEYVDLSNNRLTGDLTALAARFPNATTLNVAGNRLSQISAALPATITTLEMGAQTTGETVALDYTGNSIDAFYDVVPSIARYNHATRSFEATPELWITTSDYQDIALFPSSTWAMKLTDSGVLKVSDNVVFTGANGAAVHVFAANNTHFDAEFSFLAGDTNFDRTISVLDLQGTLNCIFNRIAADAPFNRTAADIKIDGIVNVLDVATIVKTIINSAPAAAPMLKAQSMAGSSLAYCADGSLLISSAEPVAAFDITVADAQLPRSIPQLDAAGFNYSVNGGRIVGYSLSGATLPQGISEIATIDNTDAYVTYVELSNSQAKAISENAGVSGIDALSIDATDDNGEWFNIQGIRIARPSAPGIYIHNNKKIIIR